MVDTPRSIAGATFPELLEQLWRDRHDGPVLVQFAGGKPQYIEVLRATRVRCVDLSVSSERASPPDARTRASGAAR